MPRGYNSFQDVIHATADGADLNRLWAEMQASLDIQNQHRSAIAQLFTASTTARAEAVAQGTTGSSFEVASEFGEPQGLRVSPASGRLGFGFTWWDIGQRFTWKFLSEATADQVAIVHNSVLEADNRLIFLQVMRTLLTNTAGVRPVNEDGVPILPLWDGQADATPPDFAGTSFTAGHQHYLTSGAAVIDSGDVEALITHVQHHGFGLGATDKLIILCNPAQGDVIASFRAGVTNSNAAVARYDFIPSMASVAYLTNLQLVGERPPAQYNGLKVSGSYGDAFVCPDPFMPAGYVVAVASAGPNSISNVLAFREHVNPALQGLHLWAGPANYPLTESYYQRGFGLGIRQRGAAAAMQITANANYANPTLALS